MVGLLTASFHPCKNHPELNRLISIDRSYKQSYFSRRLSAARPSRKKKPDKPFYSKKLDGSVTIAPRHDGVLRGAIL